MTNVGRELAQAREGRALSLTELARRTKISEAALRAIERNDARALPRGIYVRGFLRAYAREVGCDPDELVRRYLIQFDDEGVEGKETLEQSTAGLKAQCDPDRLHSASIDAMDRRGARTEAIGTVVIFLLGVLLYFSHGRTVHPRQPSSDPSTVSAPQPRPAEEAPIPRTGRSSDGPRSIDEESHDLRLVIQPRGLCWLSGTADGGQVIYRLLNAGERIQIEAHEDVGLRIGDAASFEFTINGVAARPLGASGQAVTIHLTRQNYQEFLGP